MNNPDGLLVHLSQQIVLLGASSFKNWAGTAPAIGRDFPWLPFEQILAPVLQFFCEGLLVGNQLLRGDLIGAIEQVGDRFVDLERHVLGTDVSPRNSKHVGADNLQMFNLCVFQILVLDARSPSSFGQDERSRGHDRLIPLFLEGSICLLTQPHTFERLVKIGDHFLEHLGLKSAEVNSMAPPENRNDDLALGLPQRWIDLEGALNQSAQVAWAGRELVSLQPSSQELQSPWSEQCFPTAINGS